MNSDGFASPSMHPRIILPFNNRSATSIVTCRAPRPTTTNIPRDSSALSAIATTSGSAVVSSACVAPRTTVATSSTIGSTAWLAPSSTALSRRDATGSTTTRASTPIAFAAITAARPTPPAPNTTSREFGSGLRTFRTAPAPVWNPHPSGAATVRSIDGSTTTTLSAAASAYCAKLDCPKNDPNSRIPFWDNVAEPSARPPDELSSALREQ